MDLGSAVFGCGLRFAKPPISTLGNRSPPLPWGGEDGCGHTGFLVSVVLSVWQVAAVPDRCCCFRFTDACVSVLGFVTASGHARCVTAGDVVVAAFARGRKCILSAGASLLEPIRRHPRASKADSNGRGGTCEG